MDRERRIILRCCHLRRGGARGLERVKSDPKREDDRLRNEGGGRGEEGKIPRSFASLLLLPPPPPPPSSLLPILFLVQSGIFHGTIHFPLVTDDFRRPPPQATIPRKTFCVGHINSSLGNWKPHLKGPDTPEITPKHRKIITDCATTNTCTLCIK